MKLVKIAEVSSTTHPKTSLSRMRSFGRRGFEWRRSGWTSPPFWAPKRCGSTPGLGGLESCLRRPRTTRVTRFHGLEVLMPYTRHHIHAKYWDRWKTEKKDWNDVARSVRILNAHKFTGTISIEYEHGPWDDIEGSKWLMNQVMAAL